LLLSALARRVADELGLRAGLGQASAGMLFPSTKFNAAINALLAEHLLSYVELASQNPYAKSLADAMLAAARSRAPKTFDAARFVEEFNAAPRFTQLNVIAAGFQELGRTPQGASWRRVRKPFSPLESSKKLEKAQHTLFFHNGIDVRIRSGSFKLMDWGLCDLRLGTPQDK
jgi:hypothetical protein